MSSMWNSVKKYFSWSDNTSGNYEGELYQEKESDLDMMECDQSFHTNSKLARIDEEKRYDTQNYFDDEYLDLIIDEGEDGPECNHLKTEDDYKNFNKLVEKAGIADLKSELVKDKDIDNTARDLPVYSYRHKASDADGSKGESESNNEDDLDNESEEDCISDMDDESIRSKEREESDNDSSIHICNKKADVPESKSLPVIETEETSCYQDSESYEDKVKDVSNLDTRQYFSDILPDVSSDESSEDEPLDTVPKRIEELPDDKTVTTQIKAIDSSSAPSDMLKLDEKNPEITKGFPGTLLSPVTSFKFGDKPVQLSQEKLPLWKQLGKNMPELAVMSELPRQLRLDSSASGSVSETKENGENGQQPAINKLISSAINMPELESEIDVDMKLCDENSFLVPSNGIVEGIQKEVQGSVNSLPENVQANDKSITGDLKEESHFISLQSLQKDASYHKGKIKEVETCLAVESIPNKNSKNKESPKSSVLGNKPFVLDDEGKERRMFENSSSTGQTENYRELSPLREGEIKPKSTTHPISSTILKQDGISDKKIQGCSNESSISHGSVERNESSNEYGTVKSNNLIYKEQKSTIKNKILTERAPEINTGSDCVNIHNGKTGRTYEKVVSLADVGNEQEARSEKNSCQQSISDASKHDEIRNTHESFSQGKTEAKLNSPSVSTMPRLEIEVENTPSNSNDQNKEFKNMFNGIRTQNYSELEHDFSHSSRKMLTPEAPLGRPSIGAVEIKMENGVLRLSVTPGPEVGNHANGREVPNSRAFDNCSLVSKGEIGTQTITDSELTRNQDQKNADYFQQKSRKSAEPRILSDWFSTSTAELGIPTTGVRDSPIVYSLDKKADSQQMPIRTVEKAEVETLMGGRKDPCRRADNLRVTLEGTSKSSFLSTNPKIPVAEIGTQVNDDWPYGSCSVSDKPLVMKAEAATQTSMIESSRGQNAITISDLQEILERIFGVTRQPKFSKASVETQTTAPQCLYPSSSINNPEMASCSCMNAVPFHKKSTNLCVLEGSDCGFESRSHCKCSIHVPYQLDSSNPASIACSSSQYNSTPKRGPNQIKKLLDVSRHSRLEFNPVSPQTYKTVPKNLSNMMNHNQSAVEYKGNCSNLWKPGQITAHSPQTVPSSYVNVILTPTSSGSPGANQATPVKVTPSGSKSSRKRTGQKCHDSKGFLNPENTSGNGPVPSGINVTASPKKVFSTPNPVIFISCSCSVSGSVQGRDLIIVQRPNTVNPMIESAKENTVTANERVCDVVAKPAVKQYVDSPSSQKVILIDQSLSKTVSENSSDGKTMSGSHLFRALTTNTLPNGRSGNTTKEDKDNVIADKVSQERLNQNSNAPFSPADEYNASISSFKTSSVPPKHLVNATNGSDLENIGHAVSLTTFVKPTEDQHESKSTEEAEQKINVIDSHNSTPIQATEHKNLEMSIVKEESCNESSSYAGNSLKNQSASDKVSSNHVEEGNRKRKSSGNADSENKISPSRCLRKREETSSSSLEKEKKKGKKDSSKLTNKSLIVPKSEQELSSAKSSKKRKHPTNISRDQAKKKKAENNSPRSTAPSHKKVVRTLRNDKEF